MMRSSYAAGAIVTGVVLLLAAEASAQKNRGREFRSLNSDLYQIEIQKNGHVDVFLAGTQPAFFDTFPMIWFADDDEPKRLKTDGRWTQRYRVEDRLGDGNGMLQIYKDIEWTLRAYPTRPYFAVQLAYTNNKKDPVTVRALMPWCVGDPGKGVLTLGENTDASAILTGFTTGDGRLSQSEAAGPDAIALFNARTGRSIIAGFITQDRASSRFEIGKTETGEEAGFYHFRAVCEFDPPVTLEPGEQLASEVLYIAVGELDPVVGVQRYARAVTVVNTTGARPAPFRAWDFRDAAQVPAEFPGANSDVVPFAMFRDGGLDATRRQSFEALGLRPSIWSDSADAGRETTGVGAVAGLDLDRMISTDLPGDGTRVERLSTAVRGIRNALGDGVQLYATRPSLLASILTDGVVAPGGTLERAVASSSIAPVTLPIGGAHSDKAVWTTAAMTDAALLLEPASISQWPDARERLALLGESAARAAIPADLFASESPRVLYARHENAFGVAHAVAVFNWRTDQSESTVLPLERLGGEPGVYYTVYDFWSKRYLGTAIDRLNVTVAPRDVTMLVMRPLLLQPMPLMIGTDLVQSLPRIESYSWDPQRLEARFVSNTASAYTLPFLVPDGLSAAPSPDSAISVRQTESARVMDLGVAPGDGGRSEIVLQFTRR